MRKLRDFIITTENQELIKTQSVLLPTAYNFSIAAQPILSLSRPLDSLNFEILLRIHQKGVLVDTASVINAAEENGSISEIDLWVLTTTMRWISTHLDKLDKTRFICVHINRASLRNAVFFEKACELLAADPTISSRICVMLHEDLDQSAGERAFVQRIQRLGAKVALDDFGTGHTSFTFLRSFPADIYKIDGALISTLHDHPSNFTIVETIVGLAKNLGAITVAEFVEDADILQSLAEIGVNYAQGFLLATPVPPAQLLQHDSSASFAIDDKILAFIREKNAANTQHVAHEQYVANPPKHLH